MVPGAFETVVRGLVSAFGGVGVSGACWSRIGTPGTTGANKGQGVQSSHHRGSCMVV